jgi:hypothetical protein
MLTLARSRIYVLAVVALALALAAAAACGGGGGGSGDGGDDSELPDAGDPPVPDAGPDGPPLGEVNVIVAGWPVGAPEHLANVPVVVFRPDGTVASTHRTNASGRVVAQIERGSLVAVINGPNRTDVRVDAAIASPGDTLRFGPDVTSNEDVGQLYVSWPARVISGYTVYYTLITPCGSFTTTTTSATLPLYKGCAGAAFDVVVTSRRSSQETTGVMIRRGVQPAPTVQIALGDGGATWNVGGFTSVPLANIPAAEETYCGGVQLLDTLGINGTSSSELSGACSMRLLPAAGTTWRVEATYNKSSRQFTLGVRQSFPYDAIVPIDGADHLPWITSVAYAPATREITWTSEAPATLDASSVQIDVSARNLSWRIYAPGGLPARWRVPALPAEHAAYDLAPTDVARVGIYNYDIVGVSSAELLQHNLHYNDNTFGDRVRRSASGRSP